MKIQFNKKSLETALQKSIKAVSARSPLPILGYVLIKSQGGGKVVFSTTDLEFGIECVEEATVMEEGSVCVPAKILNDLVIQIQEESITIEQIEDRPLELTTSKSKYHINTRDVDEFPILPSPSEEPQISVPQNILREMIKNALVAVASLEEQRVALTGVYISVDESGIIAVSTDSRRLSKAFEPLDIPPKKEFSVIIPQRSLKEIMNLLSDSETSCSITFSEGQVFMNFDGTRIFSRIIESKFPGYDAVIPKSSDIKVLVERSKLQTAVKRALIMAMDKDTPDLIRVQINGDSIRINANSVDVGDAYEEVFIQEMEGNSVELALNGKYVLDVLNVINDEFVWLYLNSAVMPVMMKSSQKENYIFIVMPVRLRKEEKEEVPA